MTRYKPKVDTDLALHTARTKWTLVHLEQAIADLELAKAAGEDDEKLQTLQAAVDRLDQQMDRLDSQFTKTIKDRRVMPTTTEKYNAALERYGAALTGVAAELAQLEADKAKYPPNYVEAERLRIIRDARGADQAARVAVETYAQTVLNEAGMLRAQAEADVSAADRTADLLERQVLAQSKADPEMFIAQAEAALAAGRPRRAALLLAVAQDKGARESATYRLVQAVEDGLDVADPARKRARSLETAVETNVGAFEATRLNTLASSGFGLDSKGELGSGSRSEVASARSAAQMAAFAAGTLTADGAE